MTKKYSALATLLGLVLLSGLAHSYVFFDVSRGFPSYWWGNQVTMKIGNLDEPYRSAMKEAANAWSSQSGMEIAYTDQNIDGCIQLDNSVSFESDQCGVSFGLALAVTNVFTVNKGTGKLLASKIVFNSGQSWGVHNNTTSRPYDFRRIALHELGHTIGLNHPDTANPSQNVSSILNSRYGSNTWELQTDDINGARALYGKAQTSFVQGVDNTDLSFIFSGDEDWFGNSGTYGGQLVLPSDGDGAFSGDITNRQTSCVEATAAHPAKFSFQWGVSSLQGRNFLRFYINDVEQDAISGTVLWTTKTYTITEPNTQLKWCYVRDSVEPKGLDGGGLNAIVYGDPQLPPANASATSNTSTQNIKFTWTAVREAASYRVFRSIPSGGSFEQVATTTELLHIDISAMPGLLYRYKVQSCSEANGGGICSNDSTVALGYRALLPPANVSASLGDSADNIRLEWDSVDGATHYFVYRRTPDGLHYTPLEGGVATFYFDRFDPASYFDGSEPAFEDLCQLVYYRVTACPADLVSCSGNSAVVRGYRNSTGTASAITDINPQLDDIYIRASTGTSAGITACAIGNGGVTYRLIDDAGVFSVSSDSGIVHSKVALMNDGTTSYSIVIEATASDGSASSETFVINTFNALRVQLKLFLEGALQ